MWGLDFRISSLHLLHGSTSVQQWTGSSLAAAASSGVRPWSLSALRMHEEHVCSGSWRRSWRASTRRQLLPRWLCCSCAVSRLLLTWRKLLASLRLPRMWLLSVKLVSQHVTSTSAFSRCESSSLLTQAGI